MIVRVGPGRSCSPLADRELFLRTAARLIPGLIGRSPASSWGPIGLPSADLAALFGSAPAHLIVRAAARRAAVSLIMPNPVGVIDMSIAELLIVAVVASASAVIAAVLVVAQEAQSRSRQRRQARIFGPAAGLLHEDGGRALGPNPELLHAVQRLG